MISWDSVWATKLKIIDKNVDNCFEIGNQSIVIVAF